MDILVDGGTGFIVGSLGSGKSLGAVKLIQQFLQKGRRVATNLDISLLDILPDVHDNGCGICRATSRGSFALRFCS